MAQTIKHLPEMWETQVRSLDQEDPLRRKGQPTLALSPRKSYGWRGLMGYSPLGHKESDTNGHIIYSKGIRANVAFQFDEGRVGN